MVCGILIRAGIFTKRLLPFNYVRRKCLQRVVVFHSQFVANRVFRNKYIGMMVDTGSMSTRAGPSVEDTVSHKEDDSARSGFVTGGCKRLIDVIFIIYLLDFKYGKCMCLLCSSRIIFWSSHLCCRDSKVACFLLFTLDFYIGSNWYL